MGRATDWSREARTGASTVESARRRTRDLRTRDMAMWRIFVRKGLRTEDGRERRRGRRGCIEAGVGSRGWGAKKEGQVHPLV